MVNARCVFAFLFCFPGLFYAQHSSKVHVQQADSLRVLIESSEFPLKKKYLDAYFAADFKLFFPDAEQKWIKALIDYTEAKKPVDIAQLFEYKTIRAYYAFRASDFEKMTREATAVIQAISKIKTPSPRLLSTKAKMNLYLAGTPFARHDPERSMTYIQEALETYQQLRDTFNIAHCLKGLAANYSELKRYDQALEYAQESATLFQAVGKKSAHILALHGIGSIHLAAQNWKTAATALESIIPQMRAHYQRPLAYALSELAIANSKLGKIDAALPLIQEADSLTTNSPDIQSTLMFYEAAATVYEANGSFEQALVFQKKRKARQKQLNQDLNNATVLELEARAQLDDKISTLEELIKQKYFTAQLRIVGLSIFAVLCAALIFCFFYKKIKRQAASKLIAAELNFEEKRKAANQAKEICLKWSENTATEPAELSDHELFLNLFTQKVQNRISDTSLTVESLAESMRISRVALYKRVKAATNGTSPSELIRKIRLETGKKFLESQPMQVSDVASRVGFKNAGNFARSFKAYFGISPSEIQSSQNENV